MGKHNYTKGCLNYTGGKYRLLPQILPLFPDLSDSTVLIPFAGAMNVTANIDAKLFFVNDDRQELINLLIKLYEDHYSEFIVKVDTIIEGFGLSRTNEKGYYKLRDHYNANEKGDPYILYALIAHSFNNQIRFNSKNEFNLPFGKRTFNDRMRQNLKSFAEKIQHKRIIFSCKDFRNLGHELALCNFIYADPPYITGLATYNSGWTEREEEGLRTMLDLANTSDKRFALSCALKNNGNINVRTSRWALVYNIHYMEMSYHRSSYHRKNNGKTVEALITNYPESKNIELDK